MCGTRLLKPELAAQEPKVSKLIQSPDCGNLTSRLAATCPKCGRPISIGDTPNQMERDASPAGVSWNLKPTGVIILFVVAIVVLARWRDFFPNKPIAGPSRANYERIEPNMTLDEVFNLLGSGKMEQYNSSYGSTYYTWEVPASSDTIEVEFMEGFDRDKLRVLRKNYRTAVYPDF